jgi:diacylglycerol kinase family enzyme
LPDVPGFLLVNPRSGDGSPTAEELCAEAERLGVSAHVLREEDDPAEVARAAGADVLGVAGGDGSLGTVAAVAIERDLPFVCVPFGTRNHFARDAGLDRDDPIGALAAFGGRERRVDVGRVGELVFLNNVSLGAYARLVHVREHHRRRRAVLARLRALAISVRHPHGLHVRIDGDPVSARVVLVANNRYELDLLSLGERERIDRGELALYVARGFAPRSLQERVAASFRLEAGVPLQAAVDGEPVTLEPSAELRVEAGSLRLLLPPG